MAQVANRIEESSKTFTAILVLGLVGLLFLIVFGNLSGNLGFADTSNTTTNESLAWVNDTTYTIDAAAITGFTGWTLITAVNTSITPQIIGVANFTVDETAGTIVGAVGRTANYSSVNLTYTATFTSTGERNTNEVIGNLTEGNVTFFSFSNVWFTLLAVVLLIIIVMSVIQVVTRKGSSSFAS